MATKSGGSFLRMHKEQVVVSFGVRGNVFILSKLIPYRPFSPDEFCVKSTSTTQIAQREER